MKAANEFDNKKAKKGDRIKYLYYGVPAVGIVRKVLENSVIVSVEDIDPLSIKQQVNDETVISHKHYSVLPKSTIY